MNATATIRKRFSAEAENWDRLYDTRPSSIYEHNLWERRRTALAYAGRTPGRILDVGCGPGNVTIELPESADITATDFAVPMLRNAQTAAHDRRKSVDLAASDATAIPFGDETFDTVMALGLMEYIPSPESVLAEMTRLLAPGGNLVISLPNAASPFIKVDDALKTTKNAVTQVLIPARIRRRVKALLGKLDAPYFTHNRHRFEVEAIANTLMQLGYDIESQKYHTFGFGVLNWVRLNQWLNRKLETYTETHPNLEKLGWTIVLKAKKRS